MISRPPRRFSPPQLAASLTVALLVGGLTSLTLPEATAAGCSVFFDTNADGFDDLAVGMPGEDARVGADKRVDAGTVTIVHGNSAGRFGGNGSQLITQGTFGLDPGSADRFGASVATADLNGDGCGDLAIGAPGEDDGAGAVVVVWGSASGLDLSNPQLLSQGAGPLIGSSAEPGDGFGSSLAPAGSLPTGGAAALWVGSPGEDVGRIVDAGTVTELRTSLGGALGSAGVAGFSQDTPGVPGSAEKGDKFGRALAGGARTLLVGIPDENVGSLTDAGSYTVFSVSSRTWTAYSQDSSGVPGTAEAGDHFGASLAHGPGCQSATDESWAVGAPGENLGSAANAGTVTIRDRSTGRGTSLQQGQGGIPGSAESGDQFGNALADAGVLAVGSPREDIGSAADAGSITLVTFGCSNQGTSEASVVAESSTAWSQNTPGVLDNANPDDRFGQTLGVSAVALTGPELALRLIVGSPGEAEVSVKAAGTVSVFVSDASGFTPAGSQTFGQDTAGIAGTPQPNDGFGGSLDLTNALIL